MRERTIGEIRKEDLVNLILKESDPTLPTMEAIEKLNERLGDPLLIAVGKAAVKMYDAVKVKIKPWKSIVITNSGDTDADIVIRSSHPLPDQESLRAGETVLRELRKGGYSSVIFLLSGGASSLMEWSDRLTLEEIRELNKRLVTSGLSIDEINVVRKHVSSVKGGRLAIETSRPVFTLIVSDVVDGDISSVGSGPTVADPSTSEDALSIMREAGITERKFLDAVSETPKEIGNSKAWVILDVKKVVNQVKEKLGGVSLTSCVRGEAKSFGFFLSSLLNNARGMGEPLRTPFLLISGGEPEVKVDGKSGKGGRNGEVCLSFARYAKGDYQFLAVATDGIDGNSEYAGCYVTQGVFSPREIDSALRDHSSYELLEKREGGKYTLRTGPTGTNVNNIYVLYAP